MLIRPSYYSIFPPNALVGQDAVNVHLGDAASSALQVRFLDRWNEEQCLNVKLEVGLEGAQPVALDLQYRNMPFNLLIQVQCFLSLNPDLRKIPAGNLTDFLLDQFSPGEMQSRLGSYVCDRSITPTLLRPEYLSRLKACFNSNDSLSSNDFNKPENFTLGDKLLAADSDHQASVLIEAVLSSHTAIESVFENPWCFAGARLPIPFTKQMAAWSKLAHLVKNANSDKSLGILSSSRIKFSNDALESYLDTHHQNAALIAAGGHQGLDTQLETYATEHAIPFIKIPKREQHQNYLLGLVGWQFITNKDHWTLRDAQGRMARKAVDLKHIKQCIPLLNQE